ncbi:MAG TPA: hypothetical protein VMM15_32640 [Bradyrhizobium sp.]|nr:hypothetical protein [Bradyrhizobium sp.]
MSRAGAARWRSACGRDLRGIPKHEDIVRRLHCQMTTVKPNHCRTMADRDNRGIRQAAGQDGIELRLQLFLKHMDKLPPDPKAAWQAVRIPQATQSVSQTTPEHTE